jgi:nucleotide-binding universal stress UspA family protein
MQLKRILVPMDFSHSALAAAREAADLARLSGGKIILLNVPELPSSIGLDTLINPSPGAPGIPLREYFARKADADFADLKAELGDLIEAVRIRPNRKPAIEIIAEAEEQDVDLIVMGTHGRQGLQRLLMGSVTETVLRQSLRPVMVIRCKDNTPG